LAATKTATATAGTAKVAGSDNNKLKEAAEEMAAALTAMADATTAATARATTTRTTVN
jgi:hypothetical protein